MDHHDPHNLPNNRPFSLVIPRDAGDICAAGPTPAWRATWLGQSVLSLVNDSSGARSKGPQVIAWSGSFAETDGGELFDEDPRTWAAPGWSALESVCRRLAAPSGTLLLRPHARHVVSDVPSCRKLLDAQWARDLGIGLVYDPAAMCAASMLAPGRIEDHLRRMYEAIELLPKGEVGGLQAIIVGVPAADGLPTAPIASDPLGRLILDLARSHIPPGLPTLTPA